MTKVAQEHGSSLVEALVAALIMTTGVVSMAQLVSIATATNLASRRHTVAMILAQQKLEELRALPWDYLEPSPSSALQQNTDGYVDYIGAYTRRWSIEPVSSNPDSSLVIQVLVTTPNDESSIARGSVNRLRGHARAATVRARKGQ